MSRPIEDIPKNKVKDNAKDLEETLFQFTKKSLFGHRKERTLEDAFEEALGLKPEEKNETADDEWI